MLGAVVVAVACVLGPGLFIAGWCALTSKEPPPPTSEPAAIRTAKERIAGYYRPGSATYLTLPEWFIVYNTEEYAAVIRHARPSSLPYFRSIRDFWTYYRRVCDVSCRAYPFDTGNHVMIVVIGSSFAVENLLKGLYENTVGRATELLAGRDTEEDAFAARTAEEYGRFLHTIPWYEFPFGQKLRVLWTMTSARGRHPLRKWERRLALSAEYAVKAVYGQVIRLATRSAYGNESQRTFIHADHVPTALQSPTVERVRRLDDGTWILSVQRYEAFTPALATLTAQGMRLLDIAGNHQVLVTAIGAGSISVPAASGRVLFTRTLAMDQRRQRTAIDAAVGGLGDLLRALNEGGMTLEHIYDY